MMKHTLIFLIAFSISTSITSFMIIRDNNSKISELENKLIIYNKNKDLFDQIVESKKHYPYLRYHIFVSVDSIMWSWASTIYYKNN